MKNHQVDDKNSLDTSDLILMMKKVITPSGTT